MATLPENMTLYRRWSFNKQHFRRESINIMDVRKDVTRKAGNQGSI
jgi:hypothetical protein